MRVVWIILVAAAVTVTLVHLRRREAQLRHEIQKVRQERVVLRRRLWHKQVESAYVTAPAEIRRVVERMKMEPFHVTRRRRLDREDVEPTN